jgi:hypothetical protein
MTAEPVLGKGPIYARIGDVAIFGDGVKSRDEREG